MSDTSWNFADIYEAVVERVPERVAHAQGERLVTWRDLDRHADALAGDLLAAGLGRESKVGCYLYNGPEYLETMYAAFKVSMVPFNTNYRYGPDELVYLFDNADADAVVFDAAFTECVDAIRSRLPNVRRWYIAGAEEVAVPTWAARYEDVVSAPVERPSPGWCRSGDDLLFLYTGGTTGMPKGVMWRQDDLFNGLGAGANTTLNIAAATSVDELARRAEESEPVTMLIGSPLMHGTGQFCALNAMARGGSVVTLASRHFDAAELLDALERRRASQLIIIGQAFAAPILEQLDADAGRWDLSSLRQVVSSGVMWSRENKEGLLRHMPQAALVDTLGSSEALGVGRSVTNAQEQKSTARFELGPRAAVFTDDGQRVEPGSGERGLLAVGGFTPIGYYKDPEKTASTFRTFDGRRWTVPGDWATVEADGTITLLGRGSVCINTGGEKVFPEEVEEILKTNPAVRDAVVVGVPDERFGEAICAVVETAGGSELALEDVQRHAKARIAAYKAPRYLVLVDSIRRAPNGKVDYAATRRIAVERLGLVVST